MGWLDEYGWRASGVPEIPRFLLCFYAVMSLYIAFGLHKRGLEAVLVRVSVENGLRWEGWMIT